jgi:putative DNA primase/helicase
MLIDDSTIAEDVAEERGYCTLPHPQEILDRGFSSVQAKTAPALAIPLFDVHGVQRDWQIRPDAPRIGRKGEIIKYETPHKHRLFLDVHPRMRQHLGNPAIPLWVTEGIKKADSLTSQGACTIGLFGGVWGFRGTNTDGVKGILDDWKHIALNGRDVRIVFDNDVMRKDEVKRALQALCAYLRKQGARLRCVAWPAAYADRKVGVDDFFAEGHTLADLEALLQEPGVDRPATKTATKKRPQLPLDTSALPPEDPAVTLGTVSPCTHAANAQRLVRVYGPSLRYVMGEGWMLWTGKFWRPDPTEEDALALGFVAPLARSIAKEAAILYELAAAHADEQERKLLHALAEARHAWAERSENVGTMAGGLKIAKDHLLLDHAAINIDPWKLNCDNGTIDLRTGTLSPHNPGDLITHIAPVVFDPTATCPIFRRFINEVFDGDPQMVAFIQRAFGACLTGIVRDRALFFLYGNTGYNGKTTIVEAFRDLLGTIGEGTFGYARKVDISTFMKSNHYNDNLRKTAQLVGARYIYGGEIDEEHRLNEQLIKDITGGDTIEARRLYRESFTFRPTFKPWLYDNHKPDIRGTDDALWGRVHLIEFTVSFADRKDDTLADKLRAELSGILNWAIEGCLEWQCIGLHPPAKVLASTKTYRNEQDTIGQFIRERCETGDGKQYQASKLYLAYRGWAEGNGHPLLSQKRFGAYLTAHNYPSDDNSNGHGAYRQRIVLLQEPERDPDDDPFEDATLRSPKNATLRPFEAKTGSANNGAGKSSSELSDATLATLLSFVSPEKREKEEKDMAVGEISDVSKKEENGEWFKGRKGSKGSNQAENSPYPIEKSGDRATGHPKAKGSIFGAPKGSSAPLTERPPPFCPGCAKPTTWLIRGAFFVCSAKKCQTAVPRTTGGAR